MPHASDDAVEVMGDEDGDLSERFVHLGPQDIIVRVRTTLCTHKGKKKKVSNESKNLG
jgi:hypothetical protein